jgi:hypothetical protein
MENHASITKFHNGESIGVNLPVEKIHMGFKGLFLEFLILGWAFITHHRIKFF